MLDEVNKTLAIRNSVTVGTSVIGNKMGKIVVENTSLFVTIFTFRYVQDRLCSKRLSVPPTMHTSSYDHTCLRKVPSTF